MPNGLYLERFVDDEAERLAEPIVSTSSLQNAMNLKPIRH